MKYTLRNSLAFLEVNKFPSEPLPDNKYSGLYLPVILQRATFTFRFLCTHKR